MIKQVERQLKEKNTSIQDELNALEDSLGEPRSDSGQNITRKLSKKDIARAGVNAIIASFTSVGYKLSAELLYRSMHIKKGGMYSPSNGNRAAKSKVVKKIKAGKRKSNSALFPKSGSTNDLDLYYSIKHFDWSKSGKKVTITDKYDFDPAQYTGTEIVAGAVKTVYLAQKYGVAVVYNIKFTV